MIIGISGKKTVGKDTVGSIIQFLTRTGCEHIQTYNDWKTVEKTTSAHTTFQNKKFADKLKDIVCILIGCSREDLEDEEFKNTLLGEEYDRYEVTYYSKNGITRVYFNTREEVGVFLKERRGSVINTQLITMTPRKMLQLMGTQGFRRTIHENIWVSSLMREYKNDKQGDLPNWVVTDVRFKNEVEAIEKRGGIVIRVNRDTDSTDEHESETELNNHEFNYVIDNNGSLEELIEQVKDILSKEGIDITNSVDNRVFVRNIVGSRNVTTDIDEILVCAVS